MSNWSYFCFFFFNDTATTEIYTLSLHDALPILPPSSSFFTTAPPYRRRWTVTRAPPLRHVRQQRSCSMLPSPDHPSRPMITSREIRLKSLLVGMPSADNFELVTVSVPRLAPGEVQVQNLWMTVDPYMRGRMADRAIYTPSSRPGKEVPGG